MNIFSITLLVSLCGFCFLLASCSDEVTLRNDKPLTRAEALAEGIDLPLPSSARNVYYLTYAGGMQDLERYMRFEVDPEQLEPAVDVLVSWDNKRMGRALAYEKKALSEASLESPRPEFLPMPWWNPGSVTQGYFRGEMEAYALQILVDEANSRIYIYQSD